MNIFAAQSEWAVFRVITSELAARSKTLRATLPVLLGCLLCLPHNLHAATVSGEIVLNATEGMVIQDGFNNYTGLDFGDALTSADGVLDTDAAGGSPASFVIGSGDLAEFSAPPAAAAATFYDFNLAGTLHVSNLLFTYNDLILEVTGPIVASPVSGVGLTPVDFLGTGILRSAGSNFSDTLVTWEVGITGVEAVAFTMTADGVPAVIPLPAASLFFASGLLVLFGRKVKVVAK